MDAWQSPEVDYGKRRPGREWPARGGDGMEEAGWRKLAEAPTRPCREKMADDLLEAGAAPGIQSAIRPRQRAVAPTETWTNDGGA